MVYSAFSMCHNCLTEMEKVHSYVKKHPQVSVREVSEATNVSAHCVRKIVTFFLNRSMSMLW